MDDLQFDLGILDACRADTFDRSADDYAELEEWFASIDEDDHYEGRASEIRDKAMSRPEARLATSDLPF